MIDKNLFLHDLAIVAILKCEGSYLKEWLDYHLLAGVNHFYLYDNESPDNQREVVAPYVNAGLVDYFYAPGKKMQMLVYNDAVKQFKFHCRYMVFIDGDEFIYPKNDCNIVEVVDEILLHDDNAAGLIINWQTFGSNGHDTADYSRGVLERFTRRAEDDPTIEELTMNMHAKTIANPRRVSLVDNPHSVKCFSNYHIINESGNIVEGPYNKPSLAKKIAVNHYHRKSWEEFLLKVSRGCADGNTKFVDDPDILKKESFDLIDENDVFDDGILHYRAARAENFSLETNEQRFVRVTDALTKNLSLFAKDTPPQNSLETALTCRALSTYLRKNFPDDADTWKLYEEASLAAILQSLSNVNFPDSQLFISALPEILRLPYPAVNAIRREAIKIISENMNVFHLVNMWKEYDELDYIRELLKLEEAD